MNIVKSIKKFIDKNFHALTHKNFRYFWIGQCASLIGTWMQSIGQSWLVLTLTKSPYLLGVLAVVQFIPITVFSLFTGVVIDKFSKKKILIFTQTASMILALILAILVFTDTVRYEYILVLAFLLGCVNCVDMPTRQSFTVEIAGKKDLMNAIALNSATFNLARILGPSIGAIIMASFGAAWCFLLNGLSYIAVLYGLYNIKVESYVRKQKEDSSILKEIKEGIVYVKNSSILSEATLMIFIVGIFAFNYNILVPSFTQLVLHENEKSYGILMSCLGLGSLIGAIAASMKSKKGPKSKVLFISSLLIGLMLIFNGLNRNFIITGLFLAITGIFNIFFSTTANSLLQLNSKDEYRGRVMSIYTLVFAGSAPIGSYITGAVSQKLGPSQGFWINGVLMIILVVIIKLEFSRNKKLKVVAS